MKPYRVKHVPSGLYYQPTKDGNNLSKQGKVYFTSHNCFSKGSVDIWISMKKNSKLLPRLSSVKFEECKWDGSKMISKIKKSDFINEEL